MEEDGTKCIYMFIMSRSCYMKFNHFDDCDRNFLEIFCVRMKTTLYNLHLSIS